METQGCAQWIRHLALFFSSGFPLHNKRPARLCTKRLVKNPAKLVTLREHNPVKATPRTTGIPGDLKRLTEHAYYEITRWADDRQGPGASLHPAAGYKPEGEGSLTSASLLSSQRHRPSSQWVLSGHLLTAPGQLCSAGPGSGAAPTKAASPFLPQGVGGLQHLWMGTKKVPPLSLPSESNVSICPQEAFWINKANMLKVIVQGFQHSWENLWGSPAWHLQ